MSSHWDKLDEFLDDKNNEAKKGGREKPVVQNSEQGGRRKGVYVGLRVHKVKVIAVVRKGNGTGPRAKEYRCKCDCGREITVQYGPLYYRTIRNCGCEMWTRQPAWALDGREYGEVKVLHWVEDGLGAWECVCKECGAIMLLGNVKTIRQAAAESCQLHASRAR